MKDPAWFTGDGDDGYTGVLGTGRVPKYDLRPEACGTLDEAQAALGLVRASGCMRSVGEIVLAVQRDLHLLMAELAAAGHDDSPFAGSLAQAHVERLEGWLHELGDQVAMPKEFVIPGDSLPGALLHVARSVVRRSERLVARMQHQGLLVDGHALAYVNRLSSLLFVLACLEDQAALGHMPTLAKES